MLKTLPVIVSPTTTRAGFKNRLITKDTYEVIPGDGSYIGKYDIPEVTLSGCDATLDFACLLAIGTTPFNLKAKQLDGLDKTDTLRSVRFTGTATYNITPGAITRSGIELITNITPEVLVQSSLSILFNGSNTASVLESNEGIKVQFNSEAISAEQEQNESSISVKFNGTLLSSQAESSLSVSVKMDSVILSSSTET